MTLSGRYLSITSLQAMFMSRNKIKHWLHRFYPKDIMADLEPFYVGEPKNLSKALFFLSEKYSNQKFTLADFVGYDDVKKKLANIATGSSPESERLRKIFRVGNREGVLLYGPPGCGKSHICRCISGELGYSFVRDEKLNFNVNTPDIATLFDIARKLRKALLFFDDVDNFVIRRGTTGGDMLTSFFLSQLDGCRADDEFLMVGATNHPERIDPALYRAGRFDRIIYIGLPDVKTRTELFRYYLRGLPTADLDLSRLAEITEYCSAADIKYACVGASKDSYAESAARHKLTEITTDAVMRQLPTSNPSGVQWFEEKATVQFGPFSEMFAPLLNDLGRYRAWSNSFR